MRQAPSPRADLSDEQVDAVLKRSARNPLIIGVFVSLALWIGSGWRNAAMLMTGALISSASLFEWQRLARVLRSALDHQKVPKAATAVVIFFVLRLTVYAGVIYGSLKSFRGSVIALLCGLGLAVLALIWEALRLLKN